MISTNIRLDDAMHEKIIRLAEQERRSMNGTLLWLLDKALKGVEDVEEVEDAAGAEI